MAGTSSGGSRRERESDSMEVLKPLVVLALFGMILYGAYSVVQKGPGPDASDSAATAGVSDAPSFVAPDVEVATARPPEAPTAVSPAPTVTAPSAPTVESATVDPDPTYLPAQSAAPPSADQVAPRTPGEATPTIAAATIPAATISAALLPPADSATPAEPPAPLATNLGDALPVPHAGAPSSAAFASAWSDAHEKLATGRYAEALAALSVWYDDPALGLEESQRLEDVLGQLAGTVIYSQQDLLLPPHVVAPGETLAAVAGPLGVSPQLLAKINGVDDPQRLMPGEHLKVVRGPFDAVVSVSRRRISLQLNGAYAGSFPVVVGRRYLEKIGASLPVVELQRGMADAAPIPVGTASLRRSIVLGEGLVIEAVDDPAAVADAAPQTSLVMTVRDLDEMLDILGPASRVLVRQ
jgi:hypothetical protein